VKWARKRNKLLQSENSLIYYILLTALAASSPASCHSHYLFRPICLC